MGAAIESTDSQGRKKAQCKECSRYFHRVDVHVPQAHEMSIAQYRTKHGATAELMSAYARERLSALTKAKEEGKAVEDSPDDGITLRLGAARLEVREDVHGEDLAIVPVHDEKYQPGRREMEQWEAIALAVEVGENALIVGPTGCGKSTAVLELAAAMNQPVLRKNLHGDVRSSDFLGEKVIDVDASTGQAIVQWRDGVLPTAMRKGYWLLLDELDAAPPQILFVLQSVLEQRGNLLLAANHGEIVRPHEHFRVLATANTLGRGDEAGLYAGTNVLNEAFLDRFGVVVEATYPDPDTEARILVGRANVKPKTARSMVECAVMVREAYEKEQCFCTFSTRRLVMWAEKAKRLGRAFDAARLTVLNRLSGEDRKFVLGVIERVFPPHPLSPEPEAW